MTNYSYDETGVYFSFFLISVLSLVLVPVTYKWVIDTTRSFNKVSSCLCTQCHTKYRVLRRRESRRNRLSRLFRFSFILAGWALVAYLSYVIYTTEIAQPNIWDPWAVLGVSRSATKSEIKRKYYDLSLKHHPDKVPEEEKEAANALFADISKAYKTLTDPVLYEKYIEWGDPDGRQAFTMGIALPTWVIDAHNSPIVLLGYFALFGVLLPWRIAVWWYSTRKYTKDRILTKSMSVFFRQLTEEVQLKDVLGTLCNAKEFEDEIHYRGDADKKATIALTKSCTPEFEVMGGDKYESPTSVKSPAARKALAILLAHFLRVPQSKLVASGMLPEDSDRTVARAVHLLQRGLLQMTLARGWLIPSLYTMDLTQMLVQGMWHNASPLLQVPHVTPQHIKALREFSPSPVRSLQDLAEISDLERRRALKDLTDAQYDDVGAFLGAFPRIVLEKLDFRVLGEETITPGALVTCTIKIRLAPVTIKVEQLNAEYEEKKERIAEARKNGIKDPEDDEDTEFDSLGLDSEGDGTRGGAKLMKQVKQAHAPRFPADKRPAWWVFIGNIGTNRVITAERVPDLQDRKTVKLQFQAPGGVGVYPFSVFIKSDYWVGSDMRLDIQMKVDEPKSDAASGEAEEDDISDPEEDTLAGQMAVLRGQRTKQSGESGQQQGSDDSSSSSDSDSDNSSDDE